MDAKFPQSMAAKVQVKSMESIPSTSKESKQQGHSLDEGIHSIPASVAPSPETETKGGWPETLVDFLLPEVPPGNPEQSQCGIPKRFVALTIYFGLLNYTMVSGWLAFTQYRASSVGIPGTSVGTPRNFGLRFDYGWLASLVLIAVYHVIGPLPRALGDLLGIQPGGYYRYKLEQNDCLNPGLARTSMLILTTLSTVIQFGVFYFSFFDKVVEQGVKAPAAVLAVVPPLFHLGQVVGMNMGPGDEEDMAVILRRALYSDAREGGCKRRSARQKLVGRILRAKLVLWVGFGGFLTLVCMTANKFSRQYSGRAAP